MRLPYTRSGFSRGRGVCNASNGGAALRAIPFVRCSQNALKALQVGVGYQGLAFCFSHRLEVRLLISLRSGEGASSGVMILLWMFFLLTSLTLLLQLALFAGTFEKGDELVVLLVIVLLLILGISAGSLAAPVGTFPSWLLPWATLGFLTIIFCLVKFIEANWPQKTGLGCEQLVSEEDAASASKLNWVFAVLLALVLFAKAAV